MSDALDQLRELQAQDLPIHGGRSWAYVFDSGFEAVQQIGAQAVATFAGSNGLDPSAFLSMLTMENELVGFACDLVEAPPEAVGTVTSGGTESIMLAVQGARDARPDIKTPNMILPATAHASYFKAANYFKVEPRVISVDDHFRAQVGPMAQAMDDDTVLVVTSAPSYRSGRSTADVLRERGLARLHDDRNHDAVHQVRRPPPWGLGHGQDRRPRGVRRPRSRLFGRSRPPRRRHREDRRPQPGREA